MTIFLSAVAGQIIGGALAIGILTWLLSAFIAKNEPPDQRAAKVVFSAILVACLVGLWGLGLTVIVAYPLGAIPVFFIYRWRLRKSWTDDDNADPQSEIFR